MDERRAPEPVSRRLCSGPRAVWGLAVVLAAAAAVLVVEVLAGLPPHFPRALALPWPALALLFAAAEVFVVHLEVRRDAHSFSLSEIPLVLGLACTAPVGFVAARVLGAGTALVLHRRQTGIKLAFNLASFALETAAAVVVFEVLRGGAPLTEPRGWFAAFAAMAVCDLLSLAAITAAISLYDGRFAAGELRRLLLVGTIAMTTNTSLALLAYEVLEDDLRSAWLLGVVATVLFLAYRAYTALSQGHARLELLYGFTRAMGQSVQGEAVTQTMLRQTCELLRCEVAELRLFGTPSVCVRMRRGETTLVHDADSAEGDRAPWWEPAAEGGTVVVGRGDRDPGALGLGGETLKDGMAVALRGEGGLVVGVLVVGDRLGDVTTFGAEDLKLFATLANHASVSLENGRLVDRLRHEAVEKEHQALHDALTGLPNRRLFGRLVDEALARPQVSSLAVMLLDLNRFKEINDTLGHHTGDQLLCQVGRRLDGVLGDRGVIARLGGDEFAFLLPEVVGTDDALAVAGEALAAIERPFAVEDLNLDVGGSIGVAVAPLHGADGSLLLQRADVAMYSAKSRGAGAELYQADRDEYSADRLLLVGQLRQALAEGQLDVYYQPKAELATGQVVGVEALVRWHHPDRGVVSPDEFIPVAEQTGLIAPLTLQVLEQALRQCAEWRAGGLPMGVAVNLSVRSLLDTSLVDEVTALLGSCSVPADALTLEITESSIMADPSRALDVLDRLHALGVRLAIDDFGTGYSSLSYLKRLPVDEVKIDKSFVLDMATDEDDAAIVRSTVDLGHNLGLAVVAEGVEDMASWHHLVELGCDTAQGYLLSRPVPAAELQTWLDGWRAGRPAPWRTAVAEPASAPAMAELVTAPHLAAVPS